jgi:hypothetical protein
LYHRAITTKTAWLWHKNIHIDQWNRRPRNKPKQLQSSDFLTKKPKTHVGKKDNLFKCWENWISTCRRTLLDSSLSCCPKINSNWIKYLNVRQNCETTTEKQTKHLKA